MWMLVLFDLPTLTKKEQKDASEFRKILLEMGFSMLQYSVYMRVCGSKERINYFVKHIETGLPPSGQVQIFSITDKQYGSSFSYTGKTKIKNKNPEQHLLFE